MKTKLMIITAIAAVVGFSATVQAVPINGSIIFGGGLATVNTGDLGTATAFTSISGVTVTAGGETGSYAPLSGGGQAVTFGVQPNGTFTFGGNVLNPNPLTLWTLTVSGITYSFSATSVTIVSQSSSFLNLTGTGIASITGDANTVGIWTITDTAATGSKFSFSSSSTVPDGGTTVLLLGAALSGLGLLRKKLTA